MERVWPNSPSVDGVVGFVQDLPTTRDTSRLNILQMIVTPTVQQVVAGALDTRASLRALTEGGVARLEACWLARASRGLVNVVSVDFSELTRVAELAIGLNHPD